MCMYRCAGKLGAIKKLPLKPVKVSIELLEVVFDRVHCPGYTGNNGDVIFRSILGHLMSEALVPRETPHQKAPRAAAH